MLSKIISTTRYIFINYHRVVDHTYRKLVGLPRLTQSEVTPNLYVGGQYNNAGARKLKQLGITGVVNMRETSLPFDAQDFGFTVLQLPTKDLSAPSIEDLKKGVKFIHSHIQNDGKVYVHCRWGEGRGPTMAAAYLIAKEKLLPEDAINQIKKVRVFINLTNPQQDILHTFYKKIQSA